MTRADNWDKRSGLISEAKSCADGLFQEVLGRKDKADSTRNALSVLQRFKFLFYLPLNIDRNIKRVSGFIFTMQSKACEWAFTVIYVITILLHFRYGWCFDIKIVLEVILYTV